MTVVGGGVLDYVWAQHQRFAKTGTGKRQFLACHANTGQAVSLAAANAIVLTLHDRGSLAGPENGPHRLLQQ